MQTRKDDQFEDFEEGELEELFMGAQEKMERGEIDSATIAQLPETGTEVELNGLVFEVQQITKSGNVILEPKGR